MNGRLTLFRLHLRLTVVVLSCMKAKFLIWMSIRIFHWTFNWRWQPIIKELKVNEVFIGILPKLKIFLFLGLLVGKEQLMQILDDKGLCNMFFELVRTCRGVVAYRAHPKLKAQLAKLLMDFGLVTCCVGDGKCVMCVMCVCVCVCVCCAPSSVCHDETSTREDLRPS